MEFRRKKKRGISKKVRRVWLSKEGYRIVWRKEVFGVAVPVRFQACVRTLVAGNFETGYREMWDFVNHRHRLHKSMKAAVADCERHARLWSRVVRCIGIHAIREMFGGQAPSAIPKWATKLLDQRIMEIMMDTQPHRRNEDEEELMDTMPETSVSKPEKKKRKTRSGPRRATITSDAPKKRRTRSDKGKKRGPRKSKGPQ